MTKQRNISVLYPKQNKFVKRIESINYSLSDSEKFRDFCKFNAIPLVSYITLPGPAVSAILAIGIIDHFRSNRINYSSCILDLAIKEAA